MVEEKLKKKRKDLLKEGAERPQFQGEGIRVETPEQFEERKKAESQLEPIPEPVPEPIGPAPASFEEPQVLERRRAEIEGEGKGVVQTFIDNVTGETNNRGIFASDRPLVSTAGDVFDESGNIIQSQSPTVGDLALGSAVGLGSATTAAAAVSRGARTTLSNFNSLGNALKNGDIIDPRLASSANGLLKVPSKFQPKFLETITQANLNTKNHRLATQALNGILRNKKRATIILGILGSYLFSTNFSLNERGDALFALQLGIKEAREDGDIEAALEFQEILEEMTEPNIRNYLEILTPIINYPIAALRKMEVLKKTAQESVEELQKDISMTEEDFEFRARSEFFDAQEKSKENQ